MLHGLDQPQAAKLVEVVVIDAAAQVFAHDGLDQGEVALHERLLRIAVARARALEQGARLLGRERGAPVPVRRRAALRGRPVGHGSLRRPIRFLSVTVVPLPAADSMTTSSMNASMTVKPMPERSSSGREV